MCNSAITPLHTHLSMFSCMPRMAHAVQHINADTHTHTCISVLDDITSPLKQQLEHDPHRGTNKCTHSQKMPSEKVHSS